MVLSTLDPVALAMAEVSAEDERLPDDIDKLNLVLNRARLAAFLGEFAADKDVRDLLTLDVLGTAAGVPFTSTGVVEPAAALALRPFRIWEYAWLYKALGLSRGGIDVLDLGGPATHICLLAALAGCRVTSLDINPAFVEASREAARSLQIAGLDARVGDMRDLSRFADGSFDAVISCSVLEHLTEQDQETALREVGRVLRPGGHVALTFDFGAAAPGANVYLPPPHEPPPDAAAAVRRYAQAGLTVAGNAFAEEPIPGSLFRDATVAYTVASLFLSKPPAGGIPVPRCEPAGSILGDLLNRELVFNVFRNSTATNDMRWRAAALDDARAQLERATASLREQESLIQSLHTAAADRLGIIEALDTAIRRFRTRE